MHSVDADSRGRACLSHKDWAASDAAAACLTPAQGAPWHASDALPPWLLQAMRAARRRASSAFSQRQLKLLGEGVQWEAAPRPASSKQAAEMQAAKRWGWDAGQARRLSGLGLMAAFSACGRHTEHQPNMLGMLLDAVSGAGSATAAVQLLNALHCSARESEEGMTPTKHGTSSPPSPDACFDAAEAAAEARGEVSFRRASHQDHGRLSRLHGQDTSNTKAS